VSQSPRAAREARSGKGAWATTLMVWVLIIFMIVPEGFDYAQEISSAMPTQGTPLSRATWLALLGFGALTVFKRRAQAAVLLKQVNPYLLLFAALAALSVLWSIEPSVTIRRLIRVLTIGLDAMALCLLAWNTTRFQSAVRPILTIMLIGSLIFGLTNPKLAIEQATSAELLNAWHGLATQKNGLGSIAGTGVILWLHAWLGKESRWWRVLAGGGAAVACLILSRSSTSLMAAIFASILLLMLMRSPTTLRRYMPYLIALFVVTLLLYSLAVLNVVPGLSFVLKPITMLTGKDQTFSGRTAIWAIVNDHIAQSPVLGSGYGAYWIGSVFSSPSYEMTRRLNFYPTEGHNGYLDVINDLGMVGGLVLLGYLLTYLRQALRLYATVRTQGALYLALMFQQLVANLSESRWFNVLSIEFVIVTLATVSMGRILMQQRLNRSVPVAAAPAPAPAPRPRRPLTRRP
jgi:exopolysaccharide production protein ExoQ